MNKRIRKKLRKADTILSPDKMYNVQLYTFNEDSILSLLEEVRTDALNEIIDYLNIRRKGDSFLTIGEIQHHLDKMKNEKKYL